MIFDGRDERIRTSDPSVPNAVLYQTEPRPDPLSYDLELTFKGKVTLFSTFNSQ